jgi:hypothetical protein
VEGFTTTLERSHPTACAERRDSGTTFSEASSNWGGARGRGEEHGSGGGILPRTHVPANLKLDLKPDSTNSKMGKGVEGGNA